MANDKSKTETARPSEYKPQPGNKATLSLADFTDDNFLQNSVDVGITASCASSKS